MLNKGPRASATGSSRRSLRRARGHGQVRVHRQGPQQRVGGHPRGAEAWNGKLSKEIAVTLRARPLLLQVHAALRPRHGRPDRGRRPLDQLRRGRGRKVSRQGQDRAHRAAARGQGTAETRRCACQGGHARRSVGACRPPAARRGLRSGKGSVAYGRARQALAPRSPRTTPAAVRQLHDQSSRDQRRHHRHGLRRAPLHLRAGAPAGLPARPRC